MAFRSDGGITVVRWRSDEGFTMLEVAFAAFIAFVILTALFSLMIASTKQGVFANRNVIVANTVNQVIDEARSLNFMDVGTVGATDPYIAGTMTADETRTVEGVSMGIRRRVTWMDDPSNGSATPYDYKKLVVYVSVNSGQTWTAYSTYIRDDTSSLTMAPTVTWDQWVTPLSNAWVYGSIWLKATGDTTGTAGDINSFDFWENGTAITGAHWTDEGPHSWQVDTTTLTEGGSYTFKVQVAATGGGFASKSRTFFIDNDPPVWPVSGAPVMTLVPYPNNKAIHDGVPSLKVTWPTAQDGTQPSASYNILTSMSNAGKTLTGNVSAGPLTITSTTWPTTFPMQRFSLYRLSVQPRSPLGWTGLSKSAGRVVSPPSLESSWTTDINQIWTMKFGLRPGDTAPPAGYFGGAKLRYKVFESSTYTFGTPMSGTVVATYDTSGTPAPITYSNVSATSKYYQMGVWVVDSWGTTMTVTGFPVYSNVVGPSPSTKPNKSKSGDLAIP